MYEWTQSYQISLHFTQLYIVTKLLYNHTIRQLIIKIINIKVKIKQSFMPHTFLPQHRFNWSLFDRSIRWTVDRIQSKSTPAVYSNQIESLTVMHVHVILKHVRKHMQTHLYDIL